MLCKNPTCQKETKRPCKGLCGTCYARARRHGDPSVAPKPHRSFGVTECSFCQSEKGPFVKNLCKPCYYREKKNGDLEYRKIAKFCSVPNCEGIVVAHSFCGKHLTRLTRYGNVEYGYLHTKGPKRSHPLYEIWRSIHRKFHAVDTGHPWHDFWKFVEDIPEKPSSRHRLFRKDWDKPYTKENVVWLEPMLDRDSLSKRADYMRTWRAAYIMKNPKKFKNFVLKKTFGISIDEYDKMLENQHGSCAICNGLETSIDHITKEVRSLAVDHCHKTGKIRALLCSSCNKGLGHFKDDHDIILSAAAYLEKHNQS